MGSVVFSRVQTSQSQNKSENERSLPPATVLAQSHDEQPEEDRSTSKADKSNAGILSSQCKDVGILIYLMPSQYHWLYLSHPHSTQKSQQMIHVLYHSPHNELTKTTALD